MYASFQALTSAERLQLAAALENKLLTLDATATELSLALGNSKYSDDLQMSFQMLRQQGLSAGAVAACLRLLDTRPSEAAVPYLVWSGPEVPGVHARDTRRVFEELVISAEKSLWISTYAYFDGPSAFRVLAERMDRVAKLKVRLLLNIQRRRGDISETSFLLDRFRTKFWGYDWPGMRRPAVFYDPRSLDLETPLGVLHAKAIVADSRKVFITSANLTEAAFDYNFELGLLLQDQILAVSIEQHLNALIQQRRLRRLEEP